MTTKKRSPANPLPSALDAEMPARVAFERVYGFVDEAGRHRQWHPGHEITDPADIAVLIARKAPIKELP